VLVPPQTESAILLRLRNEIRRAFLEISCESAKVSIALRPLSGRRLTGRRDEKLPMKQVFPEDRDQKREMLLGAVASVRDILAANAEESDRLKTLAPASVAALRDTHLFALKLPAVLGGAEADPVTQFDVVEAVSYADSAAGWCLFIGSSAIGILAAHISERAALRIFSGDRVQYRPVRWRSVGRPQSRADIV
jgi:Acyl-CoA dehydrogenase, N-terminal domain